MAYIHNRPIDASEANLGAVMRMAAAFTRAGAPVDLTTYRGPSAEDPFSRYGVQRSFALHLVAERRGALSYPALVLQALAGGGGEVVYTRVPQVALYAMAFGRLAVLEMHTPVAALRNGARLARGLNLFSGRLQGLVAISPALDAELRAELPRFTGPRLVAPSAADDLAPPPGWEPDHDLGYVGGFTGGKGGAFVLDLAEAMPAARFLLAGDLAARPELATRAASLANVTVLGVLPPSRVAEAMARFRIGLAPYGLSVQGAGKSGIDLGAWMSPLKLAEYASAGKAIVASRLPAIEALVEDGREARLCEPQGLADWVATLQALIADRSAVARLGAEARARYARRLSWDARARRIIAACDL